VALHAMCAALDDMHAVTTPVRHRQSAGNPT
jgi:hypothetical protein